MIASMHGNHLLQQALFLLISSVWCIALPAYCRTAYAARAVMVKTTPRGYAISVDACSVSLATLFQELGTQCRLHVAWRDGHPLLQPVSMHVRDLPPEQAIKNLCRAAGIHNYLIRYRQGDNGCDMITEVVLFGNGTTPQAAFTRLGALADEKRHELSRDLHPPTGPDDGYSKKLASLSEHYRWKNEETRAWAVHLLEAMPDEVKDFGLDAIMKELDRSDEQEHTAVINEEQLYRAIEAAAPPGVAPVMMRQVRRLSEHYHNRMAGGKADASCDGL